MSATTTTAQIAFAQADHANGQNKRTSIIAGDTRELGKFEGLATKPQPWEDGMRTDPTPNTYEWWYFQGAMKDNSTVIVIFFTKPWMVTSLPFSPYLSIVITAPNGTIFRDDIQSNTDQFTAARGQTNVTMGNNWVRGNLTTYELHIKSNKGFGADLVFTRHGQSTRGGGGEGTGKFYYDPSLTQYAGWFVAQPSATVQGVLSYDGQPHHVQGIGYHDHNWGTVEFNKVLDRWYWTGGTIGNYTLVAAVQVASAFYGYQQMPGFYLAKGNQVLVEEMEHLTIQTAGNRTAPDGNTYPDRVNYHWQNGTNTVDLTLSDPRIIAQFNTVGVTNATTIGVPHYIRFLGTGELNVNIGGINETVSRPMIWEINWGH